jgi:hypothetical protein
LPVSKISQNKKHISKNVPDPGFGKNYILDPDYGFGFRG